MNAEATASPKLQCTRNRQERNKNNEPQETTPDSRLKCFCSGTDIKREH